MGNNTQFTGIAPFGAVSPSVKVGVDGPDKMSGITRSTPINRDPPIVDRIPKGAKSASALNGANEPWRGPGARSK